MCERRLEGPAASAKKLATVGLISDTHGLLRPAIAEIFRGVQMILHAGDVGGPSILAALNDIAPTQAVYGNVDDRHDRRWRASVS